MIEDTNMDQVFFATHFIVEPAPGEGLRKLSFLTATNQSYKEGKYFLGFGLHRSFSENDLNLKIKSGSIIKLPAPKRIEKGCGLWLDSSKNVFLADLKDPFLSKLHEKIYDLDISKKTLGVENSLEEELQDVQCIYEVTVAKTFKKNAEGNPFWIYRSSEPASFRVTKPKPKTTNRMKTANV